MKIEHESRFEIDFCPRLIFLLVEEELLVEKDLFRDSWIVDSQDCRISSGSESGQLLYLGHRFMSPGLIVVRQLQLF